MISKQWCNVVPGDYTTIQVPTRVRVTAVEPSPVAGVDNDGTAHMVRVAYEPIETMITTFDVGRFVTAIVEEHTDDA